MMFTPHPHIPRTQHCLWWWEVVVNVSIDTNLTLFAAFWKLLPWKGWLYGREHWWKWPLKVAAIRREGTEKDEVLVHRNNTSVHHSSTGIMASVHNNSSRLMASSHRRRIKTSVYKQQARWFCNTASGFKCFQQLNSLTVIAEQHIVYIQKTYISMVAW